MRASLIIITLAILAASILPACSAEQGTVFSYTIHVDFFAYSCNLSISKISLYDASGNVVGVGSSPYGAEIEISIRTSTPVTTLKATANGVATWSSYYSWLVNGSRSITLGSAGDYWITITMN